ncbi:hypothetical protein [Vallitalea okinawensis]|uniref:hypothetical protein n=1 Tax=Vallitalea okinawensis TaxID=2078660 RepID=UPI000CFD3618|nr:hypothetical protein [Vallitalea okinawensis]
MIKKGILKNILIVFGCILLSIILHAMTSEFSTMLEGARMSSLVNTLGLPITLILWYIIAFGGIAIIFCLINQSISQYIFSGGLRYGFAISILWQWGMLEGVSTSNNAFINELITGFCDALPILLMGCLLGVIRMRKEQNSLPKRRINTSNTIIIVVVFSVVFTSIRYISYVTNIIQSGYIQYPYFTAIWTIVMGMVIGIVYMLLGDKVNHTLKLEKILKFCIIVFGVNWFLFTMFMPFVFEGMLMESILRVMIDVLSIMLSCFIIKYVDKLRQGKDKIANA